MAKNGIHTQSLLEACLNGERKAQRQLYEQYKAAMFRLCLRYAKSKEEAEDFLQDGFFKVFSNLHQYSGKGSLAAWIRTVIVHSILQELRKKHGPRAWLPLNDQPAISPKGESALMLNDILALIQSLPIGYRTVFNLYAMEGYSHKEIGQRLGITESSSRSQYLRARKVLQQALTHIQLKEKT